MRQTRSVGAWGPGIFSDDTTSDIRGEYREHLEDQMADDEATRRVLEEWQHLIGSDEEHLLWLALAAAQWQVGRLDAQVKARAVTVIDEGLGLELWEEAGPKALSQRRAALDKLRQQLTGPAAARKTVRRPWRHVTDLRPGQVLTYRASNGQMALLRVARVDDHRVGTAPIMEWLDWSGDQIPRSRKLRRLGPRMNSGFRPPRPMTYRVARHRKKDPDWGDLGFALLDDTAIVRSGDDQAQAWIYSQWSSMQVTLERALAGNE